MSGFVAQYGQSEVDVPAGGTSTTPTAIVLSYYHKLGERTLMWFEFRQADADTAADPVNTLAATLRYDVL